jgi:hypothetical protein
MYLRLLGPFYTGFKIASGNRTGLPEAYTGFWDTLKADSGSTNQPDRAASLLWRPRQSRTFQSELSLDVDYKHATQIRHKPLYSLIDEDTLPSPVEVMNIKVVDPTGYIESNLESVLQRQLTFRQSPNHAGTELGARPELVRADFVRGYSEGQNACTTA